MFDMMVVDDDALGRKGIISSIRKEELGIASILEAGDGEEALQILAQNEKIGVILTDIKMPKMDGIALIKAVKEKKPELPMIIISGYDDFQFLRQAIQYGVNDYLLKPIDPVELQDVLLSVTEKMNMKTQVQTEGDEQLKNYTLFRLVEGSIGWSELRPKMEMLHMELEMGPYVVAEIKPEAKLDEHNSYKLAEKLNRTLQNDGKGMAFLHPAVRVICLLDSMEAYEEKKKYLRQAVEKSLKEETVNLCFGKEVEEVEGIPYSFQSLAQPQQPNGQHTSPVIRDVLAYIDVHFCEDITLKDLSERFYISSAYLGTVFKKELDCQFTDYVNQKRIHRAVELLQTTNARVYEIVEQVGFKDKNYFMRIFKKYTGMTPTKLRK